ncbi:MAG: Wzz/FepE/Etk N-terminal domain-containing protein, partial [Finegoldia magna]|nr:Wzz/FepE/Etk N-terminal domain-containing protein [Finegoldia magna]
MEELNLKEAWQAVIRKLPHIIIIMLVCALLANVFNNVLGEDSYSSKVSIMVGSPEDFEKEGAVVSKVDAMINQQLVSNVEQLLKSNAVLDTVAEKVGNGVSSSDLKKDLKVKSVPSTSIIEMEYSSEREDVTNKVLDESLKAITELTKKTMKKDNIQVVDAPNAKKKMKQLVNKIDTAIGLFLGMLIGLAYAFASYYKDPNIFSKEQLQNKLGIETVSVLSNDYNESSNSALSLLNRRIDSFDNVG